MRLRGRRIHDHERVRMFIAAVCVLILSAAALATIGRSEPDGAAAGPEPTSTAAPTSPPAATRTPDSTATPDPPQDVRQVEQAARAFLSGYLPYSYGQRDADGIRAATAELRRTLSSAPPRVPSAERDRRPRVRHLQCELDVEVACVALISDGRRRYSVPLQLVRHDRWRVAAVR